MPEPTPPTEPSPPVKPAFSTDARLRPRDVRRLALQALYTLDATHRPEPAEPPRPETPHSAAAARAALRAKQKQSDAPAPPDAATPTPDAEPTPDPEALLEALEEPFDDGDAEVPTEPKLPAVELALAAWATRHDADAQCSKLAPDWPTHRQPPIDRAILRLAWHEITTGRVDAALAINEALDLAKQFSDEKSAPFINGVLDRVAKRLPESLRPDPSASGGQSAGDGETGGDPWLSDAVQR